MANYHQILGLIIIAYTVEAWLPPQKPLEYLKHSFNVQLNGQVSRLQLQNSHQEMLKLQKSIVSMVNASVFQDLEPSKYTELGEVLGFMFHAQVMELSNLCEIILFEFTHIIQSAHLTKRENNLSEISNPDCLVKVKFDTRMVDRLSQYFTYLQTNWIYPAPPHMDDEWTMSETKAFNKILENRTMTPGLLADIRRSQGVEFYRQRLALNFKQRSDSLEATRVLKQYLTMIKHSLTDVIKLHRACFGGPQILKQLVFQKCQHVLHESSFDTFTIEDYSCLPSRSKVVVTAKVHKLTTYLDSQANEVVLMVSVSWAIAHYLVAYAYMGKLLYRRCMKKNSKPAGRIHQQSSAPEYSPVSTDSIGADLQSVRRTN